MATKRTETVKFRVTPAELADIDEAAARDDVTRSHFVRRAALAAAVPVLKPDRVGGPDNSFRRAETPEEPTNGHTAEPQRAPAWYRRLPGVRLLVSAGGAKTPGSS